MIKYFKRIYIWTLSHLRRLFHNNIESVDNANDVILNERSVNNEIKIMSARVKSIKIKEL